MGSFDQISLCPNLRSLLCLPQLISFQGLLTSHVPLYQFIAHQCGFINGQGYIAFVVFTTTPSFDFPKKKVTRLVPLVEQEQLTTPQHMSSSPDFRGARVDQCLVLCVVFCLITPLLSSSSTCITLSSFSTAFRYCQTCFRS